MKKEKTVKSYKRRTKSGKVVTVRQHTAKYDAAEHAKELAKKKGAGDELEERKKKKPSQLELPFDKETEKDILDEVKEATKKEKPSKESKGKATKEAKSSAKAKSESKSKKAETSEPAFTAAEFKEWYQGTGSAADKKVAKALRAQLGRSGYKKLEDEAIDSYSSRGHLKMFKSLGEMKGEEPKTSKSKVSEPKTQAELFKEKTYRMDASARKKEASKPKVLHPTERSYSEEELKAAKKSEIQFYKNKGTYDSSRASYIREKYKMLFERSTKAESKKPTKVDTPKKEPATQSKEGSELSKERLSKGVAFKNNKAGATWMKKNGQPFYPFGKETEPFYKVGEAVYGNITAGHGGKVYGKLNATTAKEYLRLAETDRKRKEALNNPAVPTSSAAKTKLYKMLTSKSTKLWDVPVQYKGFFSAYGNPNSKGKAFIKDYEGKVERGKSQISAKSKAKPTKKEKSEPNKDFSTTSKQVSYVRSLIKELPEADRKELNSFARKASMGQISTDALWKKYTTKKYPRGSRLRGSYAPWDKRAVSDMRNSE